MSIFNEKYNRNTFSAFLRDLLPQYIERVKVVESSERYKVIKSAEILGKCSDPLDDLYVLEMTHERDDPRVTITTDAFKILADQMIHRALVIFKNDESDTFRFSYLTVSLDEDDAGNMTSRYSNARRYSFFLGVGAKTKTPQQQLKERVNEKILTTC